LLDKLQKNTQYILEFVRVRLSQVTSLILKLASDLFSTIRNLELDKRLPKRPVKFIKRYSLQISFGIVLALFLTVSVGEGQAYQVGAADFSSDINLPEAGFIGKPQVLGTETILTGEVTQVAVMNYTIEKGDTVLSIANRYNLSVGSLLDANGIKPIDAAKIRPNDSLVIPVEDTNQSDSWLAEINAEKIRQQQLAEAARQKQLAQQRTSRNSTTNRTVTSFNGSYQVIGTMWGSYNGGLPGWCTWYAHYKRPDLKASGNARDYLRTAKAAGMTVSSTPRAGSIFVNGASGWGHVGYVEKVNGDGTLIVTDMNWSGRGQITRRTESQANMWGYIL